MNTNQLVSIAIPYYNDEKFIKDSIESVLAQTYINFELILMNHASTDNSRDIAHSYQDERIIHIDLPRNEGAGGGVLLTKFMEAAHGEYIKLFCADDIMLPDCLEKLISFFTQHPKEEIVFGDVQYVDEELNQFPDTWFSNRDNFDISDNNIDMLLKYKFCASILPLPGVLIKRETLAEIKYDISSIMLFDVSLWGQLLVKKKKINLYNYIVAYYRVHDSQMSSIKNEKIAGIRSVFELLSYTKIFFEITDLITTIKFCKDNKYAQMLQEGDEKFIKFVIAHDFLTIGRFEQKCLAYLELHNLLSNQQTRKEIFDRFGFGIKEFRELYSRIENPLPVTIYTKLPKQLKIRELLFLLARKTWVTLTLKGLRAKRKRQKNTKRKYNL